MNIYTCPPNTQATKGPFCLLKCCLAHLATKWVALSDLADRNLYWHFRLHSIWKSPGVTLRLSISKDQFNSHSFFILSQASSLGTPRLGIIKGRDDKVHLTPRCVWDSGKRLYGDSDTFICEVSLKFLSTRPIYEGFLNCKRSLKRKKKNVKENISTEMLVYRLI